MTLSAAGLVAAAAGAVSGEKRGGAYACFSGGVNSGSSGDGKQK